MVLKKTCWAQNMLGGEAVPLEKAAVALSIRIGELGVEGGSGQAGCMHM